MKRLRWWFIAILGWSFLVYNLERIHEPLNIASFVYVFVAVVASLVVAAPRRASRWFLPIMVVSTLTFLGLKGILGYEIAGIALPLTVMEVTIIWITAFIARQTALCIAEFEDAATSAMLSSLPVLDHSSSVEEEMYREVRRARRHSRPLTVVAVAPSQEDLNDSLEHFLEELQRRNLRQYAMARIGDAIAGSARECDLIAQTKSGFAIMLPELDSESAERHVREIIEAIQLEHGLTLQHGVAEFPLEEMTYSGLLDRAETRLNDRMKEATVVQHAGNLEAAVTV